MRYRRRLVALVAAAATAWLCCPTPGNAAPGDNCTQPGTAYAPVPWSQKLLDPARAWRLSNGTGVKVAVIDSGVDASHPQLAGRVQRGANFLATANGAGPGNQDCNGHGTAVASIIAGQPQTGTGFRGVAPGAQIIPVVVSEQEILDDGSTSGKAVSAAGLGNAIRWAVQSGANVVNLSLYVLRDETALRSAIDFALTRNVVVVAAVGNLAEKENPVTYPAAYPGVIGVGAVGSDGVISAESERGKFVDLVAPGVDVIAAARGGGLARFNGTSFAAPFVAGAAALVRGAHPALNARQVADRLIGTASPSGGGSGESTVYGRGLVDPVRAVTETLSTQSPAAVPVPPEPAADPATEARAADWERWEQIAVAAALIGGALTVLVLVGAFVLPRGRRRGWQPGLVAAPDQPDQDSDDESAPTQLFGENQRG